MKGIRIGQVVEDWYNGKRMGIYVICRLPNVGYALVSINGEGILKKYYTALEELQEAIAKDPCLLRSGLKLSSYFKNNLLVK